MTAELQEIRRILRAPLGAVVGGGPVTLEAKQAAWQRLHVIAKALRDTYDDPATTSGMRDWIRADMEIIRNPAAIHVVSSGTVKTSATETWSTLPFFPATEEEDSVEGLATQEHGLAGRAVVRRLFDGWTGSAAVVVGRASNESVCYYELTVTTPLAQKFLERFCTPPEREWVLAEIDGAMRAIELAVGGGSLVSGTPLRQHGLAILEFHPASADKLALHVELLSQLRAKGLLDELTIWRIRLCAGAELSGMIVLTGPAPAIAELPRLYHHAEAEAFVSTRCDNDWSRLAATATVSDVPAGGEGVDLPRTEVRLEDLQKLIRSAAEDVERIDR